MRQKWQESTHLSDRVSASGVCEATVTVRKFGWVKYRECGDLLCGKKFLLKPKVTVYQG